MSPPAQQLLVGTYTERLPHVDGKAEGVLGCAFRDGELAAPSLLAPLRNPSFLAVTPDGGLVYAVCETAELDGRPGGGVAAFARDRPSGALSPLGARPTGGGYPCHVAVDPHGRHVLVSNYGAGSVAVFPLAADGSLGERTALVQHAGSGADPVRQASPHAHMVAFPPWSSEECLVTDLGIDAIVGYTLTVAGTLVERPAARIVAAPGAGPRHVSFHPSGRHLYVVNELDSTLSVLRCAETDAFVPVTTVSTRPPGSDPDGLAGALLVSASGRYAFVSNRGSGQDDVSMFALDDATGAPSLVHTELARGLGPRDVVQSPDGRYLLVANQDTDAVVVFAIDEAAGSLELASRADVPTPACLVFA